MQISNDLEPNDYQEIQKLIATLPNEFVDLHQIWQLIDQVWDEMGCDNNNLDEAKITAFYKHPVWLLNGFFIEQHDLSLQHRHAIADWILQHSISRVLDFGGGFGTLARITANKSDFLKIDIKIDIYEPYPSDFVISQCSCYHSIDFVNSLNNKYDCLVSTDVLEHVPDPLKLFEQMIDSVNLNGYLVIANCFRPVIKCHLPMTFHFRYTFKLFTKLMGLKTLGLCKGSHAIIYQKIEEKPINWKMIRLMENCSRSLYFLFLKPFTAINLSDQKQ